MGLRATAHHMSFPVRDLARSRAFYEGVLGLEPIARPDLGPVRGIWYRAGPCEVHLIEVPEDAPVGEPPPALNPMGRHAAFAVAGYDEAKQVLLARKLEILENPRGGQLWTRDPDGHVIELIVPAAGGRPAAGPPGA